MRNFHKAGVYASSSVVAADDFADGLSASMQALSSAFFKPNLLFMAIPDKPERQEAVARLLPKASAYGLGMILFGDHPKSGLGLELTVNVWIRPASEPWDQVNRHGNLDAAMLVAHVVRNNWNAQLRLVTVVEDENELAQHRTRLTELMTLSRIHGEAVVAAGSLEDQLGQLQADLNVFGMPRELDFAAFRRWMWRGRASAIFVQASGSENVLA